METLIIGCGVAGCVMARRLAEAGHQVTIVEKRNHIAGNCYDEYDENGVLVHIYGPHIFHTNEKRVYDFLSLYTNWYDYAHEVVGNVYGKIIPIPFNLNTLHIVFGKERGDLLEKELVATYGKEARVPIMELMKNPSPDIQEVGQYVYENIFLKYTMKQWNQRPEEVDQSVTARVPVLLSYDNRYFQDTYQGMPSEGYTKMFERMIDHPRIQVILNTDAQDLLDFDFENHHILYKGNVFTGPVIFTGAVDAFFHYKEGRLPYRSLRFDFEHYDVDDYQGHGVVNYTVSEDYTRITEFKHLTGQKIKGTTIIKEYPAPYISEDQVPYYAILNDENKAIHDKYTALLKNFKNFYLLGRLAQYRYYNIDGICLEALKLADEIGE